MSKRTQPLPPSTTNKILRGALAGLIGGLAATAAKTAAEKLYPPHPGEEEKAHRKGFSAESFPWIFGAAVGAAYGAVAEIYPDVTGKYGANFGMALMAVSHDRLLPTLGLATSADQQGELAEEKRERRSEIVTNVVYGVVCETVRCVVRKTL